jgi:hypothetical protein
VDVSVADDLEQSPSAEKTPSAPASKSVQRTPGRKIDYDGAAKRLMDRCVTDARQNQARLDRDRQDWQNLLFYRGGQNQWSVYDRTTNSYVPRGTDPEQGGLPEWVPRPVTNLFGVKIDGIDSLLNQSEPSKLWSPSTGDDADRATAEVAEDADPVLLQEIGYDQLRPQLNKLAVLTNGAALVLHYDNDPKHGIEEIPLLACPGCGVQTLPDELEEAGGMCPGAEGATHGCGTPADLFEPVIGGDGKPSGVPYAKGKLCGSIATSFEYSIPSTARTSNVKDLPWILTHSGMPPEQVISRWPKARGHVDRNSTSGKKGGLQKAYARAMRQLSAPARANAPVAAAGGGSNTQGDEPVVYILHHDPIDDGEYYFPDGLLSVMVDELLLEAGPLPTQDDQGRAVKSAIIRSFAQAPGTAFAKPPADDLVPLQISRNLVDSLIQLSLMHYAAPTTYIPLSVTLETEPSGRPGEHVYYRSTVPGDKPQTEQGLSPAEGLFKYLEIIDAKMEEVSKLNSVLAGARPEGDPTLGEVQILQERGMAAFKEPFDQLVAFETDLSRMLLWIGKRSAWSDRFRQVHGDNGEWDIRQFNASDLNGKVDVQIEKSSAWPKSHLLTMLQVDKAIQNGILPPPMQDPELQTKLLIEYNLVHLKPSLDIDRKQIARELDRWKAADAPEQIAPPDPTTQELPLHLFFKKQFLKTEEFEDLRTANPPVAAAMVAHVEQIQAALLQQQMQAAAAANPQPPQKETPDTRTAVEKGDHSALESAVQSGVLSPAGAQQKPDALGAAVHAGVLTPAGAVPPAGPTGPSVDELMRVGVMTPAPRESVPTPPAG